MLQNGDAGRRTVHRDKWKGKLDVGDVVYLAVQYSEPAHKSLMGLDGRRVLSIDGEWLKLSSGDDNWEAHVHRKYFCSVGFFCHWGNPCLFCGYEKST